MIWGVAAIVFAAGCFGGLVNSVVTGEMKLPYLDKRAKIYYPGWAGTVLVGGVAATSSWGLYGPLAQFAVIGQGSAPLPSLKVAEVFGALIIGFGGGRWLTAEVGRLTASRERDALEKTKKDLLQALRKHRSARGS
jgi:hypothetical protein